MKIIEMVNSNPYVIEAVEPEMPVFTEERILLLLGKMKQEGMKDNRPKEYGSFKTCQTGEILYIAIVNNTMPVSAAG
jgi:hypothetical protein